MCSSDSNCGRRLIERSRGSEIQPIVRTNDGLVTNARDFTLRNPSTLCLEGTGENMPWFKVCMFISSLTLKHNQIFVKDPVILIGTSIMLS